MFNARKISVLLLALCLMLTWLPMANMEAVELSDVILAEDALLEDIEGPIPEQEDFVLGGDDEEEAPADEPVIEEEEPADEEPADEAPAEEEAPVEEDADDEEASDEIEEADLVIEEAPEAFEEATYEEVLLATPLIVTQPQNVPAILNSTVYFSVSAPNATAFQWQYSNDGGVTFKNSGITGNKTDTIEVFLKASYLPYYWRCIVTGENGRTETSAAATTVAPSGTAAVIVTQPQDVQSQVNTTVYFTIVAENVTAYQWQYSNDGGKTFKNSGITGNKTDTIEVFLKSSYVPYLWRCAVTGEDGNTIYSAAAGSTLVEPGTLVIKKQPQNAQGIAGDKVYFSIVAENAKSYKWQYSKDGGTTWNNSGVTGNTTDTIEVTLKTSYLPYLWRCVVTGNDGAVIASDAAATVVPPAAIIKTQPQDAQGILNDTVYFTIVAENVKSYKWQYSKDGGKTFNNSGITGNDTDTIEVFLKSSYLPYQWRCVVTGLDGKTVTSDAAKTVTPAAAVIKTQPQDAQGILNDTVYFTIVAENVKSYKWQYSKDGGKTFNNSGITGNTTDTIEVFLKSSYLPYQWRCVVTGLDGKTVTSNAAKTVTPPSPVITTQPQDAIGALNDTVYFTIVAENVKSYKWQYSKDNGANWSNSGITGNTTDTIEVFLKSSYLPYQWRCVVTGLDGSTIISNAAKTVTPPAAVIITQPQYAEGMLNDTVYFTIVAENVKSYKWQYSKDNGTTWSNSGITGNTTDTIEVFLKASYLPYLWRCVVTGLDGNTVTSYAVGTIQPITVVDHVCYQLIDNVMTVVGYDGDYSEYAVVETVNGYTVTVIGESAFEGNTNLYAIDLPDTIEIIGKRAFAGCTSLAQMN